jgi:hypothetical protein
VERAKQQLLLAATIKNVNYDAGTGQLSFQVQNNSAHKLISGFPEGRRMFVNIKAYDSASNLIYEVNPYDVTNGTLKGLSYPYQPDPNGILNDPDPLNGNEVYIDSLVYEMKPTSTLTGETKTFHFALATGRYKDNRIPPKGFNIDGAAERIAVPVVSGVDTPGLYTSAEYSGGYDEVSLTIPASADTVEVNLYYQTTSREYIEFLRDEINGTGNLTLPTSPGVPGSGDPTNYIIQSDAFFTQLKAWGDTLWNLWTHNMNVDGAAPFLMAQAVAGTQPTGCTIEPPLNLAATAGNAQVSLEWSAAAGATGYNVYYDQAGKAQLVADAGNTLTYVDSGLTNDVEYCYKITAYDTSCESAYSNILCTIPRAPGQATIPAGVSKLDTGILIGKGKDKVFTLQTLFNPGDGVVIQATVLDGATGLPLADATVDLLITGPESLTLVTGLSNAEGIAEVTWNTQAPRKNNPGTLAGEYQVTVKGVTLAGYHWDSVTTNTTFTIQ